MRELRPWLSSLRMSRPGARVVRPYFEYILRQLECPSIKPRPHELWQNHDKRVRRYQLSVGYEPNTGSQLARGSRQLRRAPTPPARLYRGDEARPSPYVFPAITPQQKRPPSHPQIRRILGTTGHSEAERVFAPTQRHRGAPTARSHGAPSETPSPACRCQPRARTKPR